MKFYKYRNGNKSFEYSISEKLDKIIQLQEGKNESIICGVISAILSNFIANKIDKKGSTFAIVLVILYFITLGAMKILKGVIKYSKEVYRRKKFSEYEEIIKQEELFDKIIPEVILGISLINRVEELRNEGQKVQLRYIYALQSLHCFQNLAVYLDDSYFGYCKKQQMIRVEAAGVENILWIVDNALECLGKIVSYFSQMDVKTAKTYYENKKNDLLDIQKKNSVNENKSNIVD